jgi:hypothetical protein
MGLNVVRQGEKQMFQYTKKMGSIGEVKPTYYVGETCDVCGSSNCVTKRQAVSIT